MKKNKNIILPLAITSLIFCIFLSASYFMFFKSKDTLPKVEAKDAPIKESESNTEKEFTLTSLGNLIVHDSQIKGAKTSTGYNFDKSFEYISPLLKNSNLSIGVIEGSFSGKNYSGYPLFNIPDEFLTSVQNAGLDLITFATNHSIDKGIEGFKRGILKIKENGMEAVGVRSTPSEKKYTVYDLDGHKIGFFAYTFKTDGNRGESINSIPLSPALAPLINTFNYNKPDKMNAEVKEIISSMKADGVEFIFSSVHWGDEYATKENASQRNIAKMLNSNGVDIILGGHPHVIQPYETLTSNNGHKTLVLYSQGNTLSNQCTEEIGNPKTEDGIIAQFKFGLKDSKLYLKSYDIIPTWVYREPNVNGTLTHRIIPVEEALKNPSAFNIPDKILTRLNRSLNDTKKILGEQKSFSQQFN